MHKNEVFLVFLGQWQKYRLKFESSTSPTSLYLDQRSPCILNPGTNKFLSIGLNWGLKSVLASVDWMNLDFMQLPDQWV
jgi:hypothetical protein